MNWEDRDKRVAAQIDGHYCYDWDEMAVSAWTFEYDCCTDYKKSWLGRIINRVVMWRFNRAAAEAEAFYPWKKPLT